MGLAKQIEVSILFSRIMCLLQGEEMKQVSACVTETNPNCCCYTMQTCEQTQWINNRCDLFHKAFYHQSPFLCMPVNWFTRSFSPDFIKISIAASLCGGCSRTDFLSIILASFVASLRWLL